MKISVVMVDGGFRPHFNLLDCLSEQTLKKDEYELIWVEFYGDIADGLKAKKDVDIVTLNKPEGLEYHSSYCFNEGLRRSSGEVVVIPDADVSVEPDFLETVWREHDRCADLAVYFRRMDEPEGLHDEAKSASLEHLRNVCVHANPYNYGGCLTVRRKWLVEINGYDQDIAFSSGFHANGSDVYTRLVNLGLHVKWHPSKWIYHAWHPSTLVNSERYDVQFEIIKMRQRNLATLPNYGLDQARDKAEKDLPHAGAGLLGKVKGALSGYVGKGRRG